MAAPSADARLTDLGGTGDPGFFLPKFQFCQDIAQESVLEGSPVIARNVGIGDLVSASLSRLEAKVERES